MAFLIPSIFPTVAGSLRQVYPPRNSASRSWYLAQLIMSFQLLRDSPWWKRVVSRFRSNSTFTAVPSEDGSEDELLEEHDAKLPHTLGRHDRSFGFQPLFVHIVLFIIYTGVFLAAVIHLGSCKDIRKSIVHCKCNRRFALLSPSEKQAFPTTILARLSNSMNNKQRQRTLWLSTSRWYMIQVFVLRTHSQESHLLSLIKHGRI